MIKRQKNESGVAMVEMALTFSIFWIAVFALIEFSRAMFAWNAAAEATKMGARLASICQMGAAQHEVIRAKVSRYINASGLIDISSNANWLEISYGPSGCDELSCQTVEVKLSNLQMTLLVPFFALNNWNLPEFKTVVLRESLSNTINSETNQTCS